jgi:hypothetical protein
MAAALCMAGAGTLTLTSPSASADVASLKQKAETKTAKAVKRKLLRDRTPGLAKHALKIKVPSCKQRNKRGRLAGFRCRWKVKGELPGLVPVRCKGQATVDAKAKKSKPGRCKNQEEPQAPLQRQPADVLFGYFEDFSTVPGLYGFVGAGGGNVIREGITWRVLQPTPGGDPSTWDWSTFDAVYSQAIAAGLRPVFTFRDAPCWAAPAPCDPNAPNPVDPAFVDEYANAAAQIALRYPMSLAIEIWFEPNSDRFWGGDRRTRRRSRPSSERRRRPSTRPGPGSASTPVASRPAARPRTRSSSARSYLRRSMPGGSKEPTRSGSMPSPRHRLRPATSRRRAISGG